MTQKDIDLKLAIQKFQKTCPPQIKKKIIYLFFHWLRKKQAFHPFLYNFIVYERYLLRFPQDFLTDAFKWDATKEGYDFWNGLDNQWYTYCKKNNFYMFWFT